MMPNITELLVLRGSLVEQLAEIDVQIAALQPEQFSGDALGEIAAMWLNHTGYCPTHATLKDWINIYGQQTVLEVVQSMLRRYDAKAMFRSHQVNYVSKVLKGRLPLEAQRTAEANGAITI